MPCAISSIGSLADRVLLRLAAAAWLCAASTGALFAGAPRVAILPPVDHTGRSAPLERIQDAIEESLTTRGLAPLGRADLEAFLSRHRIRYTGGISDETARLIGEETGVEGVLLTSVDDWETVLPPRCALTSRWVAAAPGAPLDWMDTSAHHGQEHPGAFGVGLVDDPEVLMHRAADGIAGSLEAFLLSPDVEDRSGVPRRFRPGSLAVAPGWAAEAAAGRRIRVAVLPFVVDAASRAAGEVVASQMVRWLLATGRMEVLEPGVVREALLDARVIQEDGPSLPQIDALRSLLDVDLVVSGRVTDYEPRGSSPGSPFLGFSARAIDVGRRQTVWTSFSSGRGDDRLGLFGTARIRSSITLTSELVRGAVEALDEEIRSQHASLSAPRGDP